MLFVFVDRSTSAVYGPSGRHGRAPAGGSESSLLAVCEGLGARGHDVVVVQKGRRACQKQEADGVRWVGDRGAGRFIRQADAVIVQRNPSAIWWVLLRRPRGKVFVWYHDRFDNTNAAPGMLDRLRSLPRPVWFMFLHQLASADAVAVSESHSEHLTSYYQPATKFLLKKVKIWVIFNPVLPSAQKMEVEPVKNKLLFASAPHKGLDRVLENFAAVREKFPELELHLVGPRYAPPPGETAEEGVVSVGHLEREQFLIELASSWCLFYPADVLPETFGLVFAEAHMVGTPVLAHPFGSAVELLAESELVDAASAAAVVARVAAWRSEGRPVVQFDERFSLDSVTRSWVAFAAAIHETNNLTG